MGEAKNPGPGKGYGSLPYPKRTGRRRQERREPGFSWQGWRTQPAVPPHRKGTLHAAQNNQQIGGGRYPGVPTRPAPQHLHSHADSYPAYHDGTRLTQRRGSFGTNPDQVAQQLRALQAQVAQLQVALAHTYRQKGTMSRGRPPTYMEMLKQPAYNQATTTKGPQTTTTAGGRWRSSPPPKGGREGLTH